MDRRDFLKHSAVIGGGIAAGCTPARLDPIAGVLPSADGATRDLMLRALDTARAAGAQYADVRVSLNRNQGISTREDRVTGISDNETMGLGIRVLVNGGWGFAATRELNSLDVVASATSAVAQARANRSALLRPVELAPVEAVPDGRWRAPAEIDPFDVSIEEKVELLLAANREALTVNSARFVNSSMFFLREEKSFASTEGTFTHQTLYRSYPQMTVTAITEEGSDFQTRSSTDVAPRGLGYEHVLDADLVGNAPRWAEDAVQKLFAPPVEPGTYDLVLLPSHLWLTIHESIAHPTELDRIMGFEANYAGTSFIWPLEEYLGRFRYGPDFMNIQAERSSHGALSVAGWDDEGVAPQEYLIVRDGILEDMQTTRELVRYMRDWYERSGKPMRSHGQSYAQSWGDVQFHRMPNINLLPNPERDVTLDELIGGVRRGILIDGDGSFSIDQQRYNGQFGGQVFHEIRDGRIAGRLRDVAYQIRTPDFWNSMDLIGGPSTSFMGGAFNDGKGQPSQSNAVSHTCVPSRHRNVTVINTGAE
ncbi:MAG: TldD/PmbA family protein [Gemmatimonadota bacterium]